MPGAEIPSAEVGGDAGGFRVTGALHAAVRIEAWGYWQADVVAAFARQAPAVCKKLSGEAVFMLDANRLKPQGAEGQEALRVLFRAVAAVSAAKGTVVASNVMTRMQLTRLLRECGLDERVSFGDSSFDAPAG